MASPLSTRKQAVNLSTGEVRVSKIRRDPPPKIKEIPLRDPEEHDRITVAVGVLTFALALVVILIGFSSFKGSSPREYIIYIKNP